MFDENSIIDRVLSGDSSAFERLIDRYEHGVYQYALRFLGGEEDACAATEEVFSQMHRQLGSCTDTQLSTWVFRITANVCAEHQHRKRGTKSSMFSDVFHLRASAPQEEHELSEEIQIQLLRLVHQQREVLLLRDLCGLSDEETSQVLNLDENGVRQRLSRARKNLRELLIKQKALAVLPEEPTLWHNMSRECQNFRELCSRYVDGCIEDEDKSALLDHIQECKACAAYLNDLTVIGRSLAHMEEREPPEGLREKMIQTARRQAERVHIRHKKQIHRPMILITITAVIFLTLIVSGALGGLFINSQNNSIPMNAAASEEEEKEPLLADDIVIPDAVAANSYAFAIAAAGNTELPELSTSATPLVSDTGKDVEYYVVNNDLNLVQKLIDGLETVGYETEMVNNHQLVITSNASQGLFIIIHREQESTNTSANAAETPGSR